MQPSEKRNELEPALYVPGRTTAWNNSWRELYEHFAAAILAYARRNGLDEHSAEDALQEVMTAVIRSQHGQEAKRKDGSFQSWLWGVIRNRVRSVRRKSRREEVTPAAGSETNAESSGFLPEMSRDSARLESIEEQRWQQAMLSAALLKLQERVTPENFAIYTALLREKASPEELGRIYSKEANAIYAVKHRCEKILLEEAHRLRATWEQLL